MGGRFRPAVILSWDAIRRFAGTDVGRAVFHPEDGRFLLECGERVEHFEVVDTGALG